MGVSSQRVVLDDDQWIVEGVMTQMRKLISISIPPSNRSLLSGSNVVGGMCSVVVVGTDVKKATSWKEEPGRKVKNACAKGSAVLNVVSSFLVITWLCYSLSLEVATLSTHRHLSPGSCL